VPNRGMSWAVGITGEKGGFLSNRVPEPDNIIQSRNNFVDPRSLYYAQLRERLGANALRLVVLPNQMTHPIWGDLATSTWMGNGLFGVAVVAWMDEDAIPVVTDLSRVTNNLLKPVSLLKPNMSLT